MLIGSRLLSVVPPDRTELFGMHFGELDKLETNQTAKRHGVRLFVNHGNPSRYRVRNYVQIVGFQERR